MFGKLPSAIKTADNCIPQVQRAAVKAELVVERTTGPLLHYIAFIRSALESGRECKGTGVACEAEEGESGFWGGEQHVDLMERFLLSECDGNQQSVYC